MAPEAATDQHPVISRPRRTRGV